jgi:hypothetical protein
MFFDKSAIPRISAALLEKLRDVQLSAAAGSNPRTAEEAAAHSWIYFLKATEGKWCGPHFWCAIGETYG